MTMNHDNQAPGQDDGFAAGGEEFVFTEEKKPVNRNLLVLLLIAVVGGGMIYLMYLRSKGGSGADSESTRAKSEQVAEFMKKGEEDLKNLDQTLQKMQTQVDHITADASATQVPTEQLKVNPFQMERDQSAMPVPTPTASEPQEDPKTATARVLSKAQLQTIIFAANGGSTCILNSQLCAEGDQITIGNLTFKVQQIGQDFVVLKNAVGEFRLAVKSKGI